jgi:tetratricopeptide (TPR) repeat protein
MKARGAEGRPENRRVRIFCLLCILLLTAATFSPALDGGFVSWDDNVYVTENPLVKEISLEGTRKIFTSFVSGNYHPLVFATYSLEHHFFGLNPRAYHATNLALHLVNTALVFWLLLLLSGGLPAAAAGTLLFALHPMRVEAVAWVTGRKDLLGAAFFLGTLISYLHYRRGPGRRGYIPALLFFLLALFSKATTVVLPLVLLLCDFLQGRADRRAVREKIPFFALALIFGVIALFARESYQGVLLEQTDPFSDVVFMGAYRLVLYYLVGFIAPAAGLFPLYPALEAGGSLLSLRFLLLLAVIGALGTAAFFSLRYTRKAVFGALFVLVTLLPSLTVVVLGYSADRFAYLPSVGLSYLAGELFLWLWRRRSGRTGGVRVFLLLTLVAVSGALAVSSWKQCGVWRSSITLWSHAVESYLETPGSSINRAYAFHYRGLAYLKEGESVRALSDLNRAIELYPGKAEFFAGRGRLYGALGRHDAALADFDRALQVDPRSVEAYNERGIVYTETGAYRKAVADFTRALEIDPDNAMVHLNLGIVLLREREYRDAASHFTAVLRLDPASAAAFYGRARALAGRGEYRKAWQDLLQGERLGYAVDLPFRRELAERLERPP